MSVFPASSLAEPRRIGTLGKRSARLRTLITKQNPLIKSFVVILFTRHVSNSRVRYMRVSRVGYNYPDFSTNSTLNKQTHDCVP